MLGLGLQSYTGTFILHGPRPPKLYRDVHFSWIFRYVPWGCVASKGVLDRFFVQPPKSYTGTFIFMDFFVSKI